ncbi:TetR/AcrR family transcriptional regulator [Undibacterium arcticum]
MVDSIISVFRSEGYEGASLAKLSEATGLGRSSLYHHFPMGKEDMANAALDRLGILMGATSSGRWPDRAARASGWPILAPKFPAFTQMDASLVCWMYSVSATRRGYFRTVCARLTALSFRPSPISPRRPARRRQRRRGVAKTR